MRYDAMVQRCERDTHVSSHNYKGRGIKVEFSSREHFIRWALSTFPHTDFKGLDFDRKDNNGNYAPENMRLVSRSVNLKNRRARRRKTHCLRGHPLTPEAVYENPTTGLRTCRLCMPLLQKRYRDKKRAASSSTTS